MNNLKLSEAEFNREYVIDRINTSDSKIKLKLNDMGFFVGEKIIVKNSNLGKSSLLVKVMNIRYSIDKSVCEKIVVKDA